MSRNLSETGCYFCGGEVRLVEAPRPITREDCGGYFPEYEGMTVAHAECPDCLAKYTAWVDERARVKRHAWYRAPSADQPFTDLSFRSSFDDEPGKEDLPEFEVRRIPTRVGPYRGSWWRHYYVGPGQ